VLYEIQKLDFGVRFYEKGKKMKSLAKDMLITGLMLSTCSFADTVWKIDIVNSTDSAVVAMSPDLPAFPELPSSNLCWNSASATSWGYSEPEKTNRGTDTFDSKVSIAAGEARLFTTTEDDSQSTACAENPKFRTISIGGHKVVLQTNGNTNRVPEKRELNKNDPNNSDQNRKKLAIIDYYNQYLNARLVGKAPERGITGVAIRKKIQDSIWFANGVEVPTVNAPDPAVTYNYIPAFYEYKNDGAILFESNNDVVELTLTYMKEKKKEEVKKTIGGKTYTYDIYVKNANGQYEYEKDENGNDETIIVMSHVKVNGEYQQ